MFLSFRDSSSFFDVVITFVTERHEHMYIDHPPVAGFEPHNVMRPFSVASFGEARCFCHFAIPLKIPFLVPLIFGRYRFWRNSQQASQSQRIL